MLANTAQVTVEDTGSTNRSGLRVTFERDGHATVEPRGGETQHIDLPGPLCQRFMHDLEAAGGVDDLPAVHCIKSVSFGSRTFIEFNGKRSPDLSCPAAQGSRSLALQEDAKEILTRTRQISGISSRRIFVVPAPQVTK